jgi:hypothetical protein
MSWNKKLSSASGQSRPWIRMPMFLRDGSFFPTFRTRPMKCDIHRILSILDGGPDSVGSPASPRRSITLRFNVSKFGGRVFTV